MSRSLPHRLSLLTILLSSSVLALPAGAVVPDQFIAKIYSEGLGRIPDQSSWKAASTDFAANGCTLTRLKNYARNVYTSGEFNGFGYDNAAKLLALYRGVLNREPDASGFNFFLNDLNSGTSWNTTVDNFLNSTEFSNLAATICSAFVTSYNWGTHPVINLPVTTTGFQGGTGAQLQALLNATPSGGTVFLAQKSVTQLTTTLVVPSGVTLATTGLPARKKYALMGRLVRSSAFNAEMVKLNSGSKLRHVWVDGTRNLPQNFVSDAINVRLYGGTGTTVENCRMDNSRGWSTLQAVGWNIPCDSNTIRGNLVTAYSSSHLDVQWTDGLSIACGNAIVEHNEIIDATDVPIVLFRSDMESQQSQVRYNLILNAGNSAYGGLVVDPLTGGGQFDFLGSSVHDNTMWTGSRTHWDVGISVGTRPWFGTGASCGTGASVTNNTTGIVRSLVDLGIGVSCMLNTTVLGNSLTVTHVNSSNCPTLDVVAAVSAGHASGNIQTYTDQILLQCIGH